MFEIDSIPVHWKIAYTRNQTAQVPLDLDTSDLFLTIPINLRDYVILALHKCILDLAPVLLSKWEESKHVSLLDWVLELMILVHAVHIELVMRRKEVQVECPLRHHGVGCHRVACDQLRRGVDRAQNVIVRAVVLVLVQLAQLEGL